MAGRGEQSGQPLHPDVAPGIPYVAQAIPAPPEREGHPPRQQVPPDQWDPQDWLEHVLEQNANLTTRIEELSLDLRMTDARMDQTQQTARAIFHEASEEIREVIAQGTGSSTAKAQVPDKYYGDGKIEIKQWLFDLEQYYLATRTRDETQKIYFAASLLRDSAALWWRQLVEEQGAMATWREFKEVISFQFTTTNTAVETRYKLSQMSQKPGRGVTQYAREVSSLCMRLRDISEADKIFYFIKGLRQAEVRRDVLTHKPDSLLDAIRYAEISDAALYPKHSFRSPNFDERRPRYRPHFRDSSRASRGTPMSIDSMHVGAHRGTRNFQKSSNYKGGSGNINRAFSSRGRGTQSSVPRNSGNGTKTNRHEKGRCFVCGKSGHYARECKGKSTTRLNVADVHLPDDDEFDYGCGECGMLVAEGSDPPRHLGGGRGHFDSDNYPSEEIQDGRTRRAAQGAEEEKETEPPEILPEQGNPVQPTTPSSDHSEEIGGVFLDDMVPDSNNSPSLHLNY